MSTYFITGTDTEVGKTIATGLLAKELLNTHSVVTQKWIQSGLSQYPKDIDTHLKLMNKSKNDYLPYLKSMCPYQFNLAASAHLAAKQETKPINPNYLHTCTTALEKQFDIVLIEGLGGIHVPINDNQSTLDLLEDSKYPVIIVIDNKLGAINHSLLTIEALRHRKIPIEGLVFNHLSNNRDPLILKDNINIIQNFSKLSCIANIPYGKPYKLEKQKHSFWQAP